jgi:hypothetical protein
MNASPSGKPLSRPMLFSENAVWPYLDCCKTADAEELAGSIAFRDWLGAALQSKQTDSCSHRVEQPMRYARLNSQAHELRAQSMADGVLLGGPRAICKGCRFLPWHGVSKRLESTTTSGSCRENVKHHRQRMNAIVLPNSASAIFRPSFTQST